MSVFLTARWRFLAMMNYEIDPMLLLPHVPNGTELDDWNGRTFVSMVGFLFLDTKVLGVPIPFHRDFEEVNLRFYVRRQEGKELRRGVVFIKEIVPKIAIATTARLTFNENYVAMPMRHRVDHDGELLRAGGTVRYEWEHGNRWNMMTVTTRGEAALPKPGSQEEFITEHYWGYTAQRDGGTMEYRVEHPQWPVWRAESSLLDCDAAELYGSAFADVLRGQPSSVFVADGSDITVFAGKRL